MADAHKMKNDAMNLSKQNREITQKEAKIANENKIILKKDKEAKKLEALEVEVLKRLRDTHIMQ
jgi:hypothetical protein